VSLPEHLIYESEWPGWVDGTVVRGVVFHRTRAQLADRIMREGLRVEASEYGDCQGIYMAASPWTVIRHDAVTLRAVVRFMNPLRVRATAHIPTAVGISEGWADPRDVRQRLLAAGYDGVLTAMGSFGQGPPNQFVVVLRNEDVRLVVPDF
jgi:hypothetical protein